MPLQRAQACSSQDCGYVDAGCGVEVNCAYCVDRQECGTTVPNRCGVPRLCTREGWCWEAPLPQSNDIRAIWGTSSRNLWLATLNGGLLRWNGERTLATDAPTLSRYDWQGIDGLSDEALLVVGDHGSTMLRSDGGWLVEEVGPATDNFVSALMTPAGRIFAGSRQGAVYERVGFGNWLPRPASGSGAANLVLHRGQAWVVRGSGRLYQETPSGFMELPVQATLSEARDAVSLGNDLAVRSSVPVGDGGQLIRVYVISPSVDAGWTEIANLQLLATNTTSGGLARRDGGLVLVGARDTIRFIDALGDGGWSLGPTLLNRPSTASGELPRTWNAVSTRDDVLFAAGGEGAYGFVQPGGEFVATATVLNRNRPITALCRGPEVGQPIAVSEGGAVLEREPNDTWRRWDLGTLSQPSSQGYTQCVGATGRSVVVGGQATLFEYRSNGMFTRLDAGFTFSSADGGLVTWAGVTYTASNELFAVAPFGIGNSRVLAWRDGQTPRSLSVSSADLIAAGTMVSAGNNITWFAGPDGIAFPHGDGGIGIAQIPSGASPAGTVVATSGVSLPDGGSVAYAVGPGGAVWRRATNGVFTAVRGANRPEDFFGVWAAPSTVFIVGRVDAGISPEPSLFRFRNDVVVGVEALPLASRGPFHITGSSSDAGFIDVFVGADQGAILRKRFPADGG